MRAFSFLEFPLGRLILRTSIPEASEEGFYDAGHWEPSVQTLRVVYPRPDVETPSWARHKWALSGKQYRIKIGVMGGAWPYVYEKIAGPTWLTVPRSYGDTDYGYAVGTATSAESGTTVTIRVTDQERNSTDVIYTLSTSGTIDAGGMFVIASGTGNDTTGDGSESTPFRNLAKLFGPTPGSVTYANKIVLLRTGTYDAYDQGGNDGIEMRKDCSPMWVENWPGESPTIDLTNAGTTSAWNVNGSDGSDAGIVGIAYVDGPSSTNFRYHSWGNVCHRVTCGDVSAPNVKSSGSSTDNETLNYFNSPGSQRQYIYLYNLSETGRVSANGGGGFVAFQVQYLLCEGCTMTGSTAGIDLCLKAATTDCEIRENIITRTDGAQAFGTICQIDAGIETENIDIRHNYIDTGGNSDGGVDINIAFASSGQHWVRRNSVLGGAINVNTNNGACLIRSNAIQVAGGNNPVMNAHTNNPPAGTTTVQNTECHGSSGILDANILLTGQSRIDHYGTDESRGAEIA